MRTVGIASRDNAASVSDKPMLQREQQTAADAAVSRDCASHARVRRTTVV
jgi:hypothetical protein